jgi:ketosteroid isomerase-like protein
MKKLLLCLLPTAILVAATPDPQTEKEVLSVMETYRQALIRKDASALAPLLSDDLTYTHSSNLHQDKAAVLAAQNGKSLVEAMDFKNLKVRLYGNTAIVTCDLDSRSNNGGAVTATHLHVLHVLVKASAGWQLVARQATRYPEPAAGEKK